MKLVLFVALLCLVSTLVVAHDLTQVARKERQRRQGVSARGCGKQARLFTNIDLERYHRNQAPRRVRPPARRRDARSRPRDLTKDRAHWQRETEKHRRELARIDARIRRLEWRVAERKARRRAGERLRDDPIERALADTVKAMREERRRFIEAFLERGRRAGALPGWLRN